MTGLFFPFVSSIVLLLETLIVCDPVCVALPETLLFGDVDVNNFDGAAAVETPLAFVNCSVATEELLVVDGNVALATVLVVCMTGMTRTLVVGDTICFELLAFDVFDVANDEAAPLVFDDAAVVCVAFTGVTRTLVVGDSICFELIYTLLVFDVANDEAVPLLFGNAVDVDVDAEVTAYTVTLIIRVLWRIRKDECILIPRKACGKREKKGFTLLAAEEIEQIATRWKVPLSRLALFLLLFVALN